MTQSSRPQHSLSQASVARASTAQAHVTHSARVVGPASLVVSAKHMPLLIPAAPAGLPAIPAGAPPKLTPSVGPLLLPTGFGRLGPPEALGSVLDESRRLLVSLTPASSASKCLAQPGPPTSIVINSQQRQVMGYSLFDRTAGDGRAEASIEHLRHRIRKALRGQQGAAECGRSADSRALHGGRTSAVNAVSHAIACFSSVRVSWPRASCCLHEEGNQH
jgi:hypothetical protein